MSKALIKDTLRTIKKNFSRYISIMLIIALGTAFFVGIKAAAPDMFTTAEKYFADYNLMDIRIQSPAGLVEEDVEAIKKLDGVQYAAGQKFTDALVKVNGEIETDIDGTQISARAYGISPENITNFLNGVNDGAYINRPELIKGNFPTHVGECLVDASRLSTPENYKIGNVITLQSQEGDKPSDLNIAEFTIVGVVRSPYYISFERGNTTVGSGKLGTYIIIPDEAFTTDYYSEIYVKVQEANRLKPYSDKYFDYISPVIANIKSLSVNQVKIRRTSLKPTLENKIAQGEQKIESSSVEVSGALKELDYNIGLLEELVVSGEEALAKAQKEFDDKFSGAESLLSNNTEKYNAAVSEYSIKQQQYIDYQNIYNQKKLELDKANAAFTEYRNNFLSAQNTANIAENAIKSTSSLISIGEDTLQKINDLQSAAYSDERLQEIIDALQTTSPTLFTAIKSLTTQGLAVEIANYLRPYLETQKTVLAKQETELKKKQELLAETKILLDSKEQQLADATSALAAAYENLQTTQRTLAEVSAKLTSLGYDIQSGNFQLQIEKVQAEAKLNELKDKVNTAPENLAAAKKKKAETVSALDSELRAAEAELSAAKNLYNKLDKLSWNIYNRNDTPGYTNYSQSVTNIKTLSNAFPLFFFVLAAMVCLTTLKRMIDEDRALIGTYKALGYSSGSIIGKYVIYSLSACVIGAFIGIAAAIFVFPFAINSAYSIMYTLPELIYVFPFLECVLSFLFSLGCTALVTVIAISRELKTNPAVLMRPKAPKPGKRILLEHIGALWHKLSFTSKVTARNLFRNKQRFLMALLGIAGCSALLLASLGMYNSIEAIVTKQYGDNAISKYDFQIVFNSNQTTRAHSYEFGEAEKNTKVDSLMLTAMKSMTGGSERSDKKLDVYILIPEKPEELNNYISLRNRKTKKEYTLDDSGAIISEKLATVAKTDVGENIQFTDSDGNTYSVPVSAIVENYTFHYIYLTENVYKSVTGKSPNYDYAIGKLSPNLSDADKKTFDSSKGLLSTDLMKIDGIAAVAFTSDTTEIISQITSALSFVILIFFVSALVLAFVVVYNLSNINIIERTREIATLKVLGFIDKEVNSYIYRENIFVSVFGILLGALLGIGLHYLLITFTSIDTVMYGQVIPWYSYIISFAITAFIIILVNLFLQKKLKKVDMVLSLKSVE